MIKRLSFTLVVALVALLSRSQELPQFTSSDYDGWEYNNPGISLSATNIAGGKIVLYVNSQGYVHTLCSPLFSCQGVDSIEASIMWYTREFNNSSFNLSRTALTMALDDAQGEPIDSITAVPTVLGSTHNLTMRVAVPSGLGMARLRFVSWEANVVSSGAIKRALFTAITGSTSPGDNPQPVVGDVDGDGHRSIADVTRLIDCLLGGDSLNVQAADVDGDGHVSIADVTRLIDMLLGGS